MTTAKATTSQIPAVDRLATICDALSRMKDLQTDWMAVTCKGVVVGLIQERDCLGAISEGLPLHRRAGDLADQQDARLVWLS